MNEERSELGGLIKAGYRALFIEQWPSLAGGVAVGILSVLCFTWDRPWGVVGGLRVWGDWFFYAVGLYDQAPASAWTDTNSLITLGLLWGALAASLLSGQFALRVPPGLELVKGLVGGTLLGVGAALAGGCNVGGFYSSVSALSLSGFAMMAGLLAGAWVGLKYLYWEMEHLTPGTAPTLPSLGDWSRVKPWLGWALLLGGLAFFHLYQAQGYVIQGGVTLFGMAFGFTLVRSRLCFARAFREPFMTGEAKITQVVIISLMISVAGFAILKWGGLRSEISYVAPNFGLGGLVGGFIFGIGMLVTGGCGSGTAWRAAEGQIKLMAALVLFALTNSLAKAAIKASPEIQSLVGYRVFLPDWLGYQWTVVAIFLVLAVWYVAASWNERTESLVIQMQDGAPQGRATLPDRLPPDRRTQGGNMDPITFDETLDCRGLSCPMPMLKLKKALAKLEPGKVLMMMGTDPGTRNDIQKNVVKEGYDFLGFRDENGHTAYYIKKG